MKPTILVGDHFFLDKFAFPANYPEFITRMLPTRHIHRGDIVAFKSPENPKVPFIKRVIGLPNEVLEIRDKTVYIKADMRAKYEKVTDVVDNLRAAGVDQLGLLTEQIGGDKKAAEPTIAK